MVINRSSIVPLYYQLKEILKEQIELGEFKPRERVPSENELSDKYNVSRNTAKQAIASLVTDGILYREQGRGTFVSEKRVFHGLTEKLSFSAEMLDEGIKLVTKVICAEEIPASDELAKYLNVRKNAPVFRILRLREIDNVPLSLQTSYIPKSFCPTLLKYDLSKSSLFETLEQQFGIKFRNANETLESVIAGKYEAELLKVKNGVPLFLLTRKTYSVDNALVELVTSFMPGDRCKFSIELGERVRMEINNPNIL
ncbi:MAG: GntR family transcriptional regulator [Ignavibacteriales bacterium]